VRGVQRGEPDRRYAYAGEHGGRRVLAHDAHPVAHARRPDDVEEATPPLSHHDRPQRPLRFCTTPEPKKNKQTKHQKQKMGKNVLRVFSRDPTAAGSHAHWVAHREQRRRWSAETERLSAEAKRWSAETERWSAETERLSAETARLSSESERWRAESERLGMFAALSPAHWRATAHLRAEAERVSAEAERVRAEAARRDGPRAVKELYTAD
jgi:hypothetical protein